MSCAYVIHIKLIVCTSVKLIFARSSTPEVIMRVCSQCIISFILIWIHSVHSVSRFKKQSNVLLNVDTENELAELIKSKGYLPKESDLSKTTFIKSNDNDATFLLSKLSDTELLKLLSIQPKKDEYDVSDILKIATESNNDGERKPPRTDTFEWKIKTREPYKDDDNKRFRSISQRNKPREANFRLNDKPVDPYSIKPDLDPSYVALQKLSNMLYSRPAEVDDEDEEDSYKKELLFDVLISQLKTLCCKKKKLRNKAFRNQFQTLVNFRADLDKPFMQSTPINTEQLFLIINDEVKGNGSDELISVDPDSLESNSTVLLLGPITTPMTDQQLKFVMNRISLELSKPEYISLLQELSEGKVSDSNVRILKSIVTGPETRRYIKPHRCNYQSKLAKVYGGPRWIICTGYLNFNRPTMYD